jgi:hypothetical protein
MMEDNRTRWRRLVPVLAVALLAAGVACGGGSGGGGIASLSGREQAAGDDADAKKTSASDAGARGAPEDKDPEEAFLDFAKCMREHGIDMPDPDTSGGGMVKFRAGVRAGADASPEKMEEADKACRPLLGDAGPASLSPEQQQEMQDAMVAFAGCMRENGIDMPDPQIGNGGGITMKIGDGDGQGIDPQSEEFEAAQEKCAEHMPGMRDGGKAGKAGKAGKGGGMIVSRPGAVFGGAK